MAWKSVRADRPEANRFTEVASAFGAPGICPQLVIRSEAKNLINEEFFTLRFAQGDKERFIALGIAGFRE